MTEVSLIHSISATADGYGTSYYNAHFGRGYGTIHINNLKCSGKEFRLTECVSDNNIGNQYYYEHYYDWSITCKNGALYTSIVQNIYVNLLLFLITTAAPVDGEVKLFFDRHNVDSHRGILQVWLNGRWGTVSNTSWTRQNSEAVCHQLGRKSKTYTHPIITQKQVLKQRLSV